MMLRTLVLTVVAMAALPLQGVAWADDCSDKDWGDVAPSSVAATLDAEWDFYVCKGADQGGDTDTCLWWLDDQAVGELTQTTGASVTWIAPSELENCIPVVFRLYAQCTDGGTMSYSEITLQCGDDDKSDVREIAAGTTVGGGGCNSPGALAALFMLPLLGALRRRG